MAPIFSYSTVNVKAKTYLLAYYNLYYSQIKISKIAKLYLSNCFQLYSIIPYDHRNWSKGFIPDIKFTVEYEKNWFQYLIFQINCPKVLFCIKIIDIWAKNRWFLILAITFVFCFKSYAMHIKFTSNYSMVVPQWIFKYLISPVKRLVKHDIKT